MTLVTPGVKRLTRVEQQQRTRDALLDAAIELFVARGIEATSIEEVTAQAGYSRGAFYSNFASKEELVLDAGRRFLDQLHAAARPPDDRPPPEAGTAYRERLERMRNVISDSASVFIAEFSLYAIRHPEAREDFAALHQQQLEPAKAFVAATLQQAGISPAAVDVPALANIAQALTFALHLLGQFDPAVAAEDMVATGMDLVVKGIEASQPAAPGGARRGRRTRSSG